MIYNIFEPEAFALIAGKCTDFQQYARMRIYGKNALRQNKSLNGIKKEKKYVYPGL